MPLASSYLRSSKKEFQALSLAPLLSDRSVVSDTALLCGVAGKSDDDKYMKRSGRLWQNILKCLVGGRVGAWWPPGRDTLMTGTLVTKEKNWVWFSCLVTGKWSCVQDIYHISLGPPNSILL